MDKLKYNFNLICTDLQEKIMQDVIDIKVKKLKPITDEIKLRFNICDNEQINYKKLFMNNIYFIFLYEDYSFRIVFDDEYYRRIDFILDCNTCYYETLEYGDMFCFIEYNLKSDKVHKWKNIIYKEEIFYNFNLATGYEMDDFNKLLCRGTFCECREYISKRLLKYNYKYTYPATSHFLIQDNSKCNYNDPSMEDQEYIVSIMDKYNIYD